MLWLQINLLHNVTQHYKLIWPNSYCLDRIGTKQVKVAVFLKCV